MPKIEVHDAGKLALFGLLIVSASILLGIHAIDTGLWATICVGVFGYLTGNGLLASKGRTGASALRASPEPLTDDEVATVKKLAPIVKRVSQLEAAGE